MTNKTVVWLIMQRLNIMKKAVLYLRTSKKDQKLSIPAQLETVKKFASEHDYEIISKYEEHESGKNDERQELLKAISDCKNNGATLLIAKLDRLSRNVAFIFTLRDSNVNFVCCDIPDANTMTIGIFAVLAQSEREMISSRTKAALAQKRIELAKVGKKLGNADVLKQHNGAKISANVRAKKAEDNVNNQHAGKYIQLLREKGLSQRQIVVKLNEGNFKTSTGKLFGRGSVQMLLKRLEN